MVKYKLTLILLVFFAIAIGIAAMFMGSEGEVTMYNPGVIIGAVIVILCCPAFIYDQRHTDEYKLKQEEKKLQIQYQQKRLETAMKQQDLEIEKQQVALNQQRAMIEDRGKGMLKYCTYCGKQIELELSICPFCGSNVAKEVNVTQLSQIQSESKKETPIIIQQAPKQSIWAQLGAWIIQQIVYFVLISVMTVFMVVMLVLFI
ncbi:MAG: hypothetical protein ACFFD7_15445 [Candidatus Thorarchaeota archaeon]